MVKITTTKTWILAGMSRNIWVKTKNNVSYYKIKIKAIQYYVPWYDSIWIFSVSNSKPFVHVCIHSFSGFSIILTIVISHQAEMLTLTWKSTLHLKPILFLRTKRKNSKWKAELQPFPPILTDKWANNTYSMKTGVWEHPSF